MSQIEKVLLRLRKKPTPSDIKFSEIHKVLTYYGFTQNQASGGTSHYVYSHPALPDKLYTIVRHGNEHVVVKKPYVRVTCNAIDDCIEKMTQE